MTGDRSPKEPEEARHRSVLDQDPQNPNAVPTLVAHLGDPSWRVRKAAVFALRSFRGQPTLLPALIAGLASDENAGLRNACSEALVEIGEDAVGGLIEALASPDPDHRRFIVEALGAIGDTRASAALVVRLDDPDSNVRASSAEALGRLGGPTAINALRARLADAKTDVIDRAYLLEAMVRSRTHLPYDDLLPLIDDPMMTRQVCALLGLCEDARACTPLVAAIGSASQQTRAVATRGLATLLPSLSESRLAELQVELNAADLSSTLESLLEEEDDAVAAATVKILGVIGDPASAPAMLRACACRAIVELAARVVSGMGPSVVGALFERLDAEDIESRVLFLEVIESIGDADVVPMLLDIASGPDTRSAETALRVVGKLARSDAIEGLMSAARGADPELARMAGMALADLGARHVSEVAAAVRAALDAGDARPEWLVVLGALGRDEDIDLVSEATHHGDPAVRAAALEAATAFGSSFPEETVVFALTDEHPMVRVAAARALGAFRTSQAVETLLAAAQDPDPWVVAETIRSLGATQRSAVVDTVMAAAGSASSPIAIAALQSLFLLNPPGLAVPVRRALGHADPEVVREAIGLSMRLPDDAAHDLLVECLEHRSWSVRAAAGESLLTRRLPVAAQTIHRRLAAEQEPLVRDVLERLLLAVQA